MNTSSLVRFSLAVAALTLSACPKVPDADPLEANPRVLSFTASASQVTTGERVTLTWSTEGATVVRIDDVKLGAVSGVEGPSGTVEVAINDDTLFVLTVRNQRGASDTAVVQVRATTSGQGEPLLSALPNEVKAGEAVTLAWLAPGASSVELTAAPGGVIATGTQVTAGAVVVSPTVDTVYTLTAGTKTVTASVRVNSTLLSFTATPTSADAGANVTLSWQTASATRVQLLAPGRGTLLDETDAGVVASGSFVDTLPAVVDPGQLFTYELVVTGTGPQLRDTIVVSVNGNPAVQTFTAPDRVRDPRLTTDGGVSTTRLAWTTREASTLTISANGVEFYEAPATLVAAGTLDVPTPTVDTTYLLTARGIRGGAATASRTVQVIGLPTVTLAANPMTVMGGQSTTFSWTGTFITQARLDNPLDGEVFVDLMAGNTGSTQQSAASTTSWRLTVDNGFGDVATSSLMVQVTDPLVLSVTDTGAFQLGQPIAVSWTPMNAPMVGLPHDGVDTRALAFDDISTTGVELELSDVATSTINTSFRTTLFNRLLGNVITVSEYGYLVFGPSNLFASTDAPFPTAVMEPYAVVPYWDDLVFNAAYWQVKTVGGVEWLIVQWENSTASFQARISALGQVDFDYRRLPTTVAGRTGVVGSRSDIFVSASAPPDAGLTFFGPRTSPTTVRAMEEGPLRGTVDLGGGQGVRLSATLSTVLWPSELFVSEVMANSSVGTQATWVEVTNRRGTPVDLSGWSLGLTDGGLIPLSGTVPSKGSLVLGATTDSALNDDAGVSVAVSGFDLTGSSTVSLRRGGPSTSVPLASDAGVSVTHDVGVIRTSSSTILPATCRTTATYGVQPTLQLGTPGRDEGCGFPYTLTPAPYGFFDISATATRLMPSSYDSSILPISLAAAPVPFFGTARTAAIVSTNGFVSFAATSDAFDTFSTYPSTSDTNLAAVIFGDDLDQQATPLLPAGLYVQRVGPGVDPFAAAPHWIVQWSHFSYWLTNDDDLNFQIKFFDDGTIEYHYAKMLSDSSTAYGSGASATSWLENEAGTQALTINAQTASPGISPYTAYRFTPR